MTLHKTCQSAAECLEVRKMAERSQGGAASAAPKAAGQELLEKSPGPDVNIGHKQNSPRGEPVRDMPVPAAPAWAGGIHWYDCPLSNCQGKMACSLPDDCYLARQPAATAWAEEIQALYEKATRGPWTQGAKYLCSYRDRQYKQLATIANQVDYDSDEWNSNTQLIVALVNRWPDIYRSLRPGCVGVPVETLLRWRRSVGIEVDPYLPEEAIAAIKQAASGGEAVSFKPFACSRCNKPFNQPPWARQL